VYPLDKNGKERRWRYGRKTMKILIEQNRIKGSLKKFSMKVIVPRDESYKPLYSNWTDSRYNAGPHGTTLLKEILPNTNFPFPKSLYTVLDFIAGATRSNKDAIILDFFAGSGTTGHALLKLNNIDDGNRRFILCTNNENSIAEEVTYPRISKVINGYKFTRKEKTIIFEEKITSKKLGEIDIILEKIELLKEEYSAKYDEFKIVIEDNSVRLYGNNRLTGKFIGFGGNLKYFKTVFVPAKSTDRNKEKLTKQSVEMLCLKENTFESVYESDNINIFKSNDHYTGILFDEQNIVEFKELVHDFELPINVYVFSLGDDDFAEEFFDLKDQVKVCSIPAAILRVYKRIFR